MEIRLEVLASTCIKQKKPWPRITWLGEEKEAVFLLDDKNIHEINLLSGRIKKKIPQLQTFLKNVIVLTTSRNGAWLAGILKTGELFLWNKDHEFIKTVPAIEESKKLAIAAQESSLNINMYVSGKGNKVLLATPDVCVLLWESIESKMVISKNSALGQWSQIVPEASIVLPSTEEKETSVTADFIASEMLGDCCLCSFAFYSEEYLTLAFLKIKWQEKSFHSARNLDPPELYNSTRLCVKKMLGNEIEATILTGKGDGETWIPLIPTDQPFNLKRLQFPLGLAFSITINKSQGHLLSTTDGFEITVFPP